MGRESQLELAAQVLVDQGARLLTLTGPGGIGKTRLVLALAHNLADWLPGGVTIVELESLRDPSLLAAAIARAVGVLDKSGDNEADLIRWLTDDERLLVLDNFEQVIDATPLLVHLLVHCPHLRIIVTSRVAPLHLDGERVIEVGPLEFPREAEPAKNIDRNQYPAIEYFLQRAPSVDWNNSWRAVTRICQRLDGIPLALELAAARVGLLSIDEIAEQTTGWIPILTHGRRDAPERQRTMEQTIDWSYQLLDEPLRRVFRSLGVFSGGFGRDSAIEISRATQGQLTALIECRLISVTTSLKRDPRFRMLEPVRDFALQKASVEGELDDLQEKLAAWSIRFVRDIHSTAFDTPIYMSESAVIEQTIQRELANLLAALSWMIEQKDAKRAQAISSLLADYWYLTMQPGEGRKWLTMVNELPRSEGEDHTQEYVKLCIGLSLLCQLSGDGVMARVWADHGLQTATEMNDIVAIAEAHGVLGYVCLNLGEFEQSIDYGLRALNVFRQPEFEDRPWQVDILENLALAEVHLGRVEHAESLVREAVTLAREMDATNSYGNAQRALGDVLCHQGRFLDAVEAHSEGFAAGVRRHGRTSPETWHNIAEGMAGAATIAWFAFPDDRQLAISIVEKTERICRQLGMSKPDNRIDYEVIRDHLRFAGQLPDPPPQDTGGGGPDLASALSHLREIAYDLHGRLTSPKLLPLATVPPPWERGVTSERAAALRDVVTGVQLATVQAIVQGHPVKEIAASYGVRQSSIYNRIDVVKKKWGLPPTASLLEVAVFAVRHGLA
ncbi:MAG: tetratricopeptide repeat protein [Thermomicrobiales bacterium]